MQKFSFKLDNSVNPQQLTFHVADDYLSEVEKALVMFPTLKAGVKLRIVGNNANLAAALTRHYTERGITVIG